MPKEKDFDIVPLNETFRNKTAGVRGGVSS